MPTTIHQRTLLKPDGRELVLYARAPIDDAIVAPAAGSREPARSHLRWHPLRGEWVVYAGHRQNRTFLPPPQWNPLAPSVDPQHPTEVPAGAWDVAVFENLFSALGSTPEEPQPSIVPVARCGGRTEVVVFAQDPTTSLGALPLDHLEVVLAAWTDRTIALSAREDVELVMPFENRGTEVGVTLHHPHGQIYAYPFIPPVLALELSLMRAYFVEHGCGLLAHMIASEIAADIRTLHVNDHAITWLPVCARWAYELWVAPRRSVPTLAGLTPLERTEFARALQVALRKLDALWGAPMPYVLSVHQGPAKGDHPYAHLHIQIYPWLRMPGRQKFLAGSEVAAGAFTADTIPEDKAAELRAVEIP